MQNASSTDQVSIELTKGLFLSIYSENAIEKNTLLNETQEKSHQNGEEPIQILEGSTYEYELPEGYWLKSISGIVQPSRNNSCRGHITPNIYVGRLALTVNHSEYQDIDFAVEVRSIKAEYRSEYRKMLEDITTECTELLMLHSSPVTQKYSVDYEGDSSTLYQRFAFVQSIVDSDDFRNAVHRVISMPVTAWSHQIEEIDIRRSRKIGSKQIRQIASRNGRINLPKSHPLHSKIRSVPSLLSTEIKIDTVDTPENRFVKHALKEFERFCGFICQHIEKKLTEPSKYPNIYFEAQALEARFSEYLNHSLFREVLAPNSLPLNSPVLQRKEGYREILRVWLMYDLAAKLVWHAFDNDAYQVGKRNVAALYEYWLFFKLLRLIESIFKVDAKELKKLIKETDDGLGLQLIAGEHTAIEGEYHFKGRDLSIQFNFNRTFSRADYPKSGSWTQPMRPDYTLSIWPKTFTEKEAEEQELIVHVHFDAKYKVDGLEYLTSEDDIDLSEEKQAQKQGSYKRADLLKMHAYKDAIRRTVGAYVLYPGSQTYKRQGFREIIPGLGAFPVSPSNNGEGFKAVGDFIRDIVNHFSNRASQREQLSYHQYAIHKDSKTGDVYEMMPEYATSSAKIRAEPPDEATVLVGYYKTEQYKWIKSTGLYNIRLDSKGLTMFGSKEAGAKYLLLRGSANKPEDTEIMEITGIAPVPISKKDLINKGYPSKPSCDYYLLYQVGQINDNSFGGKKWDITKLPGYSSNRANSTRPFAVSLTELSKAVIS
jgi:predicted component of viral defense system (DUF524 family)